MTRLLRETMEEWAGQAEVPHDLADRALRRRRRGLLPAGAALLAAAVIAAVAVFVTVQPPGPVLPAVTVTLPARPSPAPTDVRADPDHARPTKLVAAGNLAVGAYYTLRREKGENGLDHVRRTWHLYDPRTDSYEETPWAWVDVAPGMRVAAVVQGDLLGDRIGVIDLDTRQFLSWIQLGRRAGHVAWSPDGTKLLATTYSSYPDELPTDGVAWRRKDSPRTGYYLIDVPTGRAEHHALPPLPSTDGPPSNSNGRQDLGWSLDGSLIWGPTVDISPERVYYGLDGRPAEPPPGEAFNRHGESKISPDGRLELGPDGLPTAIIERRTGKVAGSQNVLQLIGWADDEHVIALGCAGGCENEFRNGLVLVSVDGRTTVPLTGVQESQEDGSWRWVLTPR
ncbi:hypothetical protein [Nonomuraea harbinensis]|uniref:WD40 repeat domain-containing protein n=1 Tax=Nonomuraea harbinensis TaxID=1286938 RepID=A0ABW1BLC3_9ACTN|nr:hypothetical protein [Nonomuraea harbinensis]